MALPVRARVQDESGATLVELAIAMVITVVIGLLLMTSLSTSSRAAAQVDDQQRGLADLQIVTERMSRDLRAARAVDDGASASQLTLWIDDNSDYRRQATESVTWRIPGDPDAVQFDVERVAGDPEDADAWVAVIGESLVSQIAFSYFADGVAVTPTAAQSVRVSMEYDAVVGAYSQEKQVDFEVRLRNVQ